MTFEELNVAEPILKAIREKGYAKPTPIQEQGIPVALEGRDIMGIAQTGTGKTAAFSIPILQLLAASAAQQAKANEQNTTEATSSEEAENNTPVRRRDRRGRNHGRATGKRVIQALILTPTRELAQQIGDSFSDYGKYTGLKHCIVFGGVKQGPQV
jgi:ATP-dependent RNA helicase RhlE